jgi:hypothetical protein
MHDGQPQVDAVPAYAGGSADEGLEEPFSLVRVDGPARVGNVQHGVPVRNVGGDRDVPAGLVVADGVVYQVGDHAVEQRGIADDRRREQVGP